jgi:cell pole-organizing protein PopZ
VTGRRVALVDLIDAHFRALLLLPARDSSESRDSSANPASLAPLSAPIFTLSAPSPLAFPLRALSTRALQAETLAKAGAKTRAEAGTGAEAGAEAGVGAGAGAEAGAEAEAEAGLLSPDRSTLLSPRVHAVYARLGWRLPSSAGV